jgi:hypothetical protein
MKRSDQPIDPGIELGKGDSLAAADKGLLTGMEKSISIDDICESPYVVAAKFLQDEGVGHGVLLVSRQQETVMGAINTEKRTGIIV